MGRLFDRLKFIVRSYINDRIDKFHESGASKKRKSSSKTDESKQDDSDNSTNSRVDREFERIMSELYMYDNPSLRKSYSILGVQYGSDIEVVRKRWKELLKENHPDKFPDPKDRERATKISAKINEAYQEIENYLDKKV